ncbi:LysR family transcriptional regulator [Burkholderia diffusa]|uniref:LysR family transcriptional regulator n=1 Tax=Burkholderia diffusa TaxID=488732 RepID=UPI001CB40301|nr:LysR family transcriptional regulator [Burkholderia diffusa]CAG9244284.1 LysR family transcriptional regulator [Burkholderia diffusa]
MDQLLAMRVFCCIVEAEGFSAAAARLDTTHSSVSRQLKRLEAELGVQLLNRNTRRFTLTGAGAQYYDACVDILARVEAAANGVMSEGARVAGTLRVSVPLAIGTLELADWLPAFQRRYPDVRFDMSCSDRMVDLVAEGFDVALRISGPLDDSSMVAHVLTESEIVLVASPGYVTRRGLPVAPDDLREHELLTHTGATASTEWVVQPARGDAIRVELQGRLKTDAITATYSAALAGLGIAAFTRHTVQTELSRGHLVRVLPNCTLGSRCYYALYPQTRHLAPKVRAFVDYMAAHYGVR